MKDIKLYKNKSTGVKFLLDKNEKGKFLGRALTEINNSARDKEFIIEKLYKSYMFTDKLRLFFFVYSDIKINLKKLIGRDEIIDIEYKQLNNSFEINSVYNFMYFHLALYPENPKTLNKLLRYNNEDYSVGSCINADKLLDIKIIFKDDYYNRNGEIDPFHALDLFIEYILDQTEVKYEGKFIPFMELVDILFDLSVEEVKDKKEFREYVVRKNFK
ncbi:hypothetical protein [Staphylococcus phage vB_StaM_SA1]|nr:hypothetical protein [Staphylococcus phage vB_StaM_SA1]